MAWHSFRYRVEYCASFSTLPATPAYHYNTATTCFLRGGLCLTNGSTRVPAVAVVLCICRPLLDLSPPRVPLTLHACDREAKEETTRPYQAALDQHPVLIGQLYCGFRVISWPRACVPQQQTLPPSGQNAKMQAASLCGMTLTRLLTPRAYLHGTGPWQERDGT